MLPARGDDQRGNGGSVKKNSGSELPSYSASSMNQMSHPSICFRPEYRPSTRRAEARRTLPSGFSGRSAIGCHPGSARRFQEVPLFQVSPLSWRPPHSEHTTMQDWRRSPWRSNSAAFPQNGQGRRASPLISSPALLQERDAPAPREPSRPGGTGLPARP